MSVVFPRLCPEIVSKFNVDLFILLEPRCSGEKANKVIRKIGFDISLRVEAQGFFGGIWFMWNSQVGKVFFINTIGQCITVAVEVDNNTFFCSGVYGSTLAQKREDLWDHLRETSCLIGDRPWVWLGDFNSYLHDDEKQGGAILNNRAMKSFNLCVDDCGVSDLGFSGPKFTWSNGRVYERLDRALSNASFLDSFHQAKVLNLNQYKSDHRVILLKLEDVHQSRSGSGSRFAFQAAWVTHNGFKNMVKENWVINWEWSFNSKAFTEAASRWNSAVFGNIFRKKDRVRSRLEGIDRVLASGSGSLNSLERLQKQLWAEYNDILIQEEVFWAQQARCDWLALGDKNTRFFHNYVKVKRRR